MSNINNPKFAVAAAHFALSVAASRAHSAMTAEAGKLYGWQGALISGCVRDHWPETVKDALRMLAREVSTQTDLGFAAKPSRVRISTMRELGRDIATRDGSGYYGFSARLAN